MEDLPLSKMCAGKGSRSTLQCFLQEAIASHLENNKEIFVFYLDVSKAFDSVWIDGFFFQLRNIDVHCKIWR